MVPEALLEKLEPMLTALRTGPFVPLRKYQLYIYLFS